MDRSDAVTSGLTGDDDSSPLTSAKLDVRPIRSSYLQVAEQLRDLIRGGDLTPGQRLPAEPDMAALFGVSKGTIREALRILSSEGMVTTRRGVRGGTFVVEPDASKVEGTLSNAFNILAVTNKVTADDFLNAWKAIDVPASGLAARRRGGEHADALLAACQAPDVDGSREQSLEFSADFHNLLLRASGNQLLELMGRPVSAVARARFSGTSPTEEFWHTNCTEHRRIAEAIIAGDSEAAEAATAEHIESLRPYYRAQRES